MSLIREEREGGGLTVTLPGSALPLSLPVSVELPAGQRLLEAHRSGPPGSHTSAAGIAGIAGIGAERR